MSERTTTSATLGRIRKAIVAGASAGFGACVALVLPLNGGRGMLDDGKIDATEAGTLIGTFFTVGVPIGYATWQIPNKPQQHADEDAATAAARTQVSNLALPQPSAAEIAASSIDAPTDADLPAPGASAAGVPVVSDAEDDEPRHRAG